jgi:hypothetical protein
MLIICGVMIEQQQLLHRRPIWRSVMCVFALKAGVVDIFVLPSRKMFEIRYTLAFLKVRYYHQPMRSGDHMLTFFGSIELSLAPQILPSS